MQQSNPNAKFVWHDSPNPSGCKAIQGQDKCSKAILMQCLSFFRMTYPTEVDGKQSKTKTNVAKKSAMFVFFA
jgi:hypothetical protein